MFSPEGEVAISQRNPLCSKYPIRWQKTGFGRPLNVRSKTALISFVFITRCFLNPRLLAGVIDVNGWMVFRDAIFFLCVVVRSFVSVRLLRIFRSKEYPFRLYLTTMKSIRSMFFRIQLTGRSQHLRFPETQVQDRGLRAHS